MDWQEFLLSLPGPITRHAATIGPASHPAQRALLEAAIRLFEARDYEGATSVLLVAAGNGRPR